MRVSVKVKPNSSTPRLEVDEAGIITAYVAEAAHKGAANEACRTALAHMFQVPNTSVQLVYGRKSPIKIFEVNLEKKEIPTRGQDQASPKRRGHKTC